MTEKRYLIGEVSKITGISKDTLRFYDKIKLICPKFVNPQNNYRYYTYDQFWRLDIITCCRNLNIPINRIKEILNSNNNNNVLSLLLEQQQQAKELEMYYKRISDDIEWYAKQNQKISKINKQSRITVKYFPQRAVLYGENSEDTHAYHLKLQELCNRAIKHNSSIRRNYGFILDETQIAENKFIKKGEYIIFDKDIFQNIDEQYLTYLPQGKYACYITKVQNDRADFSQLISWLKENDITAKYIIADEIGLQLFEYLNHGYLCEIKIFLE